MIKIIIADDNMDFAQILKHNLKQDKEFQIQAIAKDGKQALEFCKQYEVDIVLMDIQMPICDGVEGTRLVKQYDEDIKVIVLTTFDEDKNVSEALENGADSYVLKEIDTAGLIEIIKNVQKGLTVMPNKVLKKVKKLLSEKDELMSLQEIIEKFELSEKELDIIRLIVKGRGNKEIADELFYTEGSIKNMISKILSKLNLQDRTQLAVFAIKNRIS